jgi:hypothetical protein
MNPDPGIEDFTQAAREKNIPGMALAGVTAAAGPFGKLGKLAKKVFGKGEKTAADIVKRDVDIPAAKDYSKLDRPAVQRKAEPQAAPVADVQITPRTGSRSGKELDLNKPADAPASKVDAPVVNAPAAAAAKKPGLVDRYKDFRYGTTDPKGIEAVKQARIDTKIKQKELDNIPGWVSRNPKTATALTVGGAAAATDYVTTPADQEWTPSLGGLVKGPMRAFMDPPASNTGSGDTATDSPTATPSSGSNTGSNTPDVDTSWINDGSRSSGNSGSGNNSPSNRAPAAPDAPAAAPASAADEISPEQSAADRLKARGSKYWPSDGKTNESLRLTEDDSEAVKQFLRNVVSRESGGKNIQNKSGSSAFGIAQFMPSTFKGMVQQARPDSPIYGKTWEEFKADTNLQKQTLAIATQDYINKLRSSKVPVTSGSLYMSHFFGPEKATQILQRGPDATLSSVIPEYVRKKDKRTGEVRIIKNPVYTQNPNLSPTDTVRSTYSNLSNLMQDRQVASAKKGKLAAAGTAALGALVGAKSAEAGEMPGRTKGDAMADWFKNKFGSEKATATNNKSDVKPDPTKPAAAPTQAAPVTPDKPTKTSAPVAPVTPDKPTKTSAAPASSTDKTAPVKDTTKEKPAEPTPFKFEPIASQKVEPVNFKSANPQLPGVTHTVDKIDPDKILQKNYAPIDSKSDDADDEIAKVIKQKQSSPATSSKEAVKPVQFESINTTPDPELQDILWLAGKKRK